MLTLFRNLFIEIKVILIFTLGFTLVAIFVGKYFMTMEEQHMEAVLFKQATTLFEQVQETRHWNAGYGGVYVMLKEGQTPNPYLYKVGPGKGQKSTVEPEIQDTKGRRLALINPALMTRELADILSENTDIRFHLTSLKLINPNNAPDDFEIRALRTFEQGKAQLSEFADLDGQPYYRFMKPLHIEAACLKCHGFQGYEIGDVRGGLSVSVPMAQELAASAENTQSALQTGLLVYIVTIILLVAAIRVFVGYPLRDLMDMSVHIGADTFRLPKASEYRDEIGSLWRTLAASSSAINSQRKELESYAQEMDEKSRVDALTKIHNRHHLYMEAPKLFSLTMRKKQAISTLMIDIDFFKRINDTYGHAIGDNALVLLADLIRSEMRPYDLFVRMGGEEFLLIMPDVNAAQAFKVAERIRMRIEQAKLPLNNTDSIFFTVSIGISSSENTTLNQAMIHADEAMYLAKDSGRNQTQIHRGD